MTSASDLVKRLQAFGVPEADANLYFHICRLGRATASEAAKAAGVSRTDGYRLLDQLQAKGFLEKTVERPAKFVPVPVKKVLGRLIKQCRRSLEALADEQENLALAWPQGAEIGQQKRRIATHQGRNQIQGLLERIIDGASEDITLSSTLRGIAKLDLGRLMNRLQLRKELGIPIRVLTRVEAPDLPLLRQLSTVATVRHLDLGEYHEMLIADTNSIAMFVGGSRGRDPEGGAETLLHLTTPPFVMAQKALVDHAWVRGTDLADRIRELETGRQPERAELLRGRWMRTERLKQMLFRNERVLLLAPANELQRWKESGVARVIKTRLRQGCAIMVLSDAPSTPTFPVVQVPRADRLVVVAGKQEMLVVEHCNDTGGTTNEGEWGLWSTIRSAVDEAGDRLEGQAVRARQERPVAHARVPLWS